LKTGMPRTLRTGPSAAAVRYFATVSQPVDARGTSQPICVDH
jgi:hypothetical protein